MAAYEVCYKKAMRFEEGKYDEEMEVLRLLEEQGLKPFLSHTPESLLTGSVIEFVKNLHRDEDGEVFTTLSYDEGAGKINETLNVRNLARCTFQIPHQGQLHNNISVAQVQEVLDMAIVTPQEGNLLKLATLGGHYKVLVNIIHKCFIGLLGSKDQVSGEQRRCSLR